MKENFENNIDRDIKNYYEGNLTSEKEFLEIKELLDKMNVINGIEEKIALNVEVDEIINRGEEIKTEKAIKKFTTFATVFAVIISTFAFKYPFSKVIAIQFILAIILVAGNLIFRKLKLKGEH